MRKHKEKEEREYGRSMSEGSPHKGMHQVRDIHAHNTYECKLKDFPTNIKYAKPKL